MPAICRFCAALLGLNTGGFCFVFVRRMLNQMDKHQLEKLCVQELARNTPLPRLAESMFPAHPADPVNLAWLAEFQVPPLRAAWYIRIHTIHRWHQSLK